MTMAEVKLFRAVVVGAVVPAGNGVYVVRGPLSTPQVGRIFGISQQRVHQIEQEAMRKLLAGIESSLRIVPAADTHGDAMARRRIEHRAAPPPKSRDELVAMLSESEVALLGDGGGVR